MRVFERLDEGLAERGGQMGPVSLLLSLYGGWRIIWFCVGLHLYYARARISFAQICGPSICSCRAYDINLCQYQDDPSTRRVREAGKVRRESWGVVQERAARVKENEDDLGDLSHAPAAGECEG